MAGEKNMSFLIQNNKLLKYTDEEEPPNVVAVPQGVTAIGDYAFSHTSPAEVVIPHGVTSIGMMAFEGCFELSRVELPETISYIGRGAFQYCRRLADMTIPKKTVRLNDKCFYYCSSLKTITLHEQMIFGTDVFDGCGEVENLNIGSVRLHSKALRAAVKVDQACVEKLVRSVRYGSVPEVHHAAVKAQAAAEIFFAGGSESAKSYLKRNALSVFKYLADDGRADLLLKLAGESDIVSCDIDALIEAAIAAEQHEVYIMLADLRHGTMPCESLSDRFAL